MMVIVVHTALCDCAFLLHQIIGSRFHVMKDSISANNAAKSLPVLVFVVILINTHANILLLCSMLLPMWTNPCMHPQVGAFFSILPEFFPKVKQPAVELCHSHILTHLRGPRFPARHLSFFALAWYNEIPLGAKQGFAAPDRR